MTLDQAGRRLDDAVAALERRALAAEVVEADVAQIARDVHRFVADFHQLTAMAEVWHRYFAGKAETPPFDKEGGG